MADFIRSRWMQVRLPRRDTIHQYRLLRPFAHHLSRPNLWRMNHRSVPRAVALGLGLGMVIPVMHMVLAALLAIPARANVAIAAACTLVINPLTIPPLYYAAYRIGSWELQRDTLVTSGAAAKISGELARMLFWLHQASGPIALGILTVSIAAAISGYAVTALSWRLWVRARWRQRRSLRRPVA